MDPQLEVESFGVVVTGSFTPAIFQPMWFAKWELIRQEEAEKAHVDLIHSQATRFTVDDWLAIQVTPVQCVFDCRDPSKLQPVRDLVVGTFRVLDHTPLKAYGLNRHCHFQMPTIDDWHEFGHTFAPKAPWESVLEKPGLRDLAMEGRRPGCDSAVKIRLQPSTRVKAGIYIHIHEHHDLVTKPSEGEPSKLEGVELFATAEKFEQDLSAAWQGFIDHTNFVTERLFLNAKNKAANP